MGTLDAPIDSSTPPPGCEGNKIKFTPLIGGDMIEGNSTSLSISPLLGSVAGQRYLLKIIFMLVALSIIPALHVPRSISGVSEHT
jgi:hypothetical protein